MVHEARGARLPAVKSPGSSAHSAPAPEIQQAHFYMKSFNRAALLDSPNLTGPNGSNSDFRFQILSCDAPKKMYPQFHRRFFHTCWFVWTKRHHGTGESCSRGGERASWTSSVGITHWLTWTPRAHIQPSDLDDKVFWPSPAAPVQAAEVKVKLKSEEVEGWRQLPPANRDTATNLTPSASFRPATSRRSYY